MDRKKTAVIIPVLNEEDTIGQVIDGIPDWVHRILVCDNDSTDASARIAKERGADVLLEKQRGYGAACKRGVDELITADHPPEIVIFLDGDLSDDPAEMGTLVAPIVNNDVELVIGSRVLGNSEKGALTTTQRFGNWLSCRLTRLFFGVNYTDLGPFRAITFDALQSLDLDDTGYGWTIQMQVRAASRNKRITEVPVTYRNRRGGKSKVSGTVRGVVGAGTIILFMIFKEAAESRMAEHSGVHSGVHSGIARVISRAMDLRKQVAKIVPLP